jgi:hypothetical protein
MNISLFDRLEQNAVFNDVRVRELRQEIADAQARIAGLEQKYELPKDIGLGSETTHATGPMNDERRLLEREIATAQQAVTIHERQSRFNKQHMYFRGPDELSPTNAKVLSSPDTDLAGDATAAGLTVWSEDDVNPPYTRDGKVTRVLTT